MQVIYKRKEIKDLLKNLKKEKSIGFVPTMGALHEGHISLLSRSVKENDFNVVSIFVNPTQFNDKEDLKNYPRELEADLQKLKKAGCDLVFVPGEMEIYPEQDNRFFDLEGLDENMEGKSRKGHFNGVAQVVTKLFDIVMPTNAYFGEKDFQQLAIIRFLTKKLNYPINIIGCPTLREKNGLAMSSRNQLLSADQKREAGNISKTLFKSIELSKNYNVEQVK
ncbi:MAG: pantoate--beta-alanine ligase, partial [bacterium]